MPNHRNRLRRFWKMAYRAAQVRGVPHHEAEAIAQNLAATVPPDVLAGSTARWRAWILVAAGNQWYSIVRRRYAERKALAAHFRERQPRRSSVPITDQDTERLLGVVGHVLSKLMDEERHVLYLRYWRPYSLQEIADELGVGVDAAKKRLQRARDRFRDEWNRFRDESDDGPEAEG